jgi:CRP/FNR family transcriptional regulator, cyclic AMP receptor protein
MNLREMRAGSALLRAVEEADLGFLETVSVEVKLARGQVLFEEGGRADTFYIVAEGTVGLELTSPGKEPVVIQTLGKGDLVGVSWLFEPHRWEWRARALADTILAACDAAAVRRRCTEDRDLAYRVLGVVARVLAERLHRTRIQLLDLYAGR